MKSKIYNALKGVMFKDKTKDDYTSELVDITEEFAVNFMERNLEKVDEKEEMYLGNKIVAWKYKWEEYNDEKDKWEQKSQVYCNLYRIGSKWQPLNLGECNDDSKFTAVNQAVNQAKDFVNVCNQYSW